MFLFLSSLIISRWYIFNLIPEVATFSFNWLYFLFIMILIFLESVGWTLHWNFYHCVSGPAHAFLSMYNVLLSLEIFQWCLGIFWKIKIKLTINNRFRSRRCHIVSFCYYFGSSVLVLFILYFLKAFVVVWLSPAIGVD